MKRLYLSDLDGTLLDSSGRISDFTVNAINSCIKDGFHFAFATARSVYSASKIMSEVNIDSPCILMNGVSIYDLKRNIYLVNEYIPTDASAEIISAFRENGIQCFMYKIHEGILSCYFTEITDRVMQSFAEERKNRYNKPFIQCNDLMDEADSETVYFTVMDEYEKVLPVKKAAAGIAGVDFAFYEDTYTGKWYLEIFSSAASKANGVKKLRKDYGFDEIVCFGDNLNDIPMFNESDVKIAVENARPEIMARADHITLSNDNDGVAKYLLERKRRNEKINAWK